MTRLSRELAVGIAHPTAGAHLLGVTARWRTWPLARICASAFAASALPRAVSALGGEGAAAAAAEPAPRASETSGEKQGAPQEK